jgi:hypothetical protein
LIRVLLQLKRKLSIENPAAIAADCGSSGPVTFVTAANFLKIQNIEFGDHMAAILNGSWSRSFLAI